MGDDAGDFVCETGGWVNVVDVVEREVDFFVVVVERDLGGGGVS